MLKIGLWLIGYSIGAILGAILGVWLAEKFQYVPYCFTNYTWPKYCGRSIWSCFRYNFIRLLGGFLVKKVLILILIFVLLFVLTGCASGRITLDDGQTVKTIANFYIIKELYHSSFSTYPVSLGYDPETKVMYYIIGWEGNYCFSVSPYYLSNGVVGIYGVNYK